MLFYTYLNPQNRPFFHRLKIRNLFSLLGFSNLLIADEIRLFQLAQQNWAIHQFRRCSIFLVHPSRIQSDQA